MSNKRRDFLINTALTLSAAALGRNALLEAAQETALHLHENEATPDPSDRASMEEDHTLELRVRDPHRYWIDLRIHRAAEIPVYSFDRSFLETVAGVGVDLGRAKEQLFTSTPAAIEHARRHVAGQPFSSQSERD